jgi:protease YdgD
MRQARHEQSAWILVLALAAVPPAAAFAPDWDGLLSTVPPVAEFLRSVQAPPVSAVPAGIFDDDGRVVKNSALPPWKWAGILWLDGKRGCSAVLVANNFALTAAHCVDGATTVEFQWDLGDSSDRNGDRPMARVVAIRKARNYNLSRRIGRIVREDWAVLKLAAGSPPGFGHTRIAKSVSVGAAAMSVGYPETLGRASHRIVDPDCSVKKLDEDSIRSDCGISQGNSGGPLFVRLPSGEFELAGLASSQFIDENGRSVYGVPYSDARANLFVNLTLYRERIIAIINAK